MADLASTGRWNKVPCALVIEDEPVGDDSRLDFESFPEDGIEEVYAVNTYREIGGDRMPQPAEAAYRGGNWQTFNLKLVFRSGLDTTLLGRPSPGELQPGDLDDIYIEMERKVRWCEALAFPLQRNLGTFGERIIQRARTAGVEPTTEATEAIQNLQRNDPPIVLVCFGQWHIIRGYVTNVTVRWQGPWHPVTARPSGAEVTLAFQPILTEYPTWQTIRNLPGQVGSSTLKLDEIENFALQEAERKALVERDLANLRERQEQAARERREAQRQASINDAGTASAGQGLG